MMNYKKIVGLISVPTLFVGFIAVFLWWIVSQWVECRNMGLSVFYCIKHVL